MSRKGRPAKAGSDEKAPKDIEAGIAEALSLEDADPAAAAAALKSLLEIHPGSQEALKALVKIRRGLNDKQALASSLVALSDATPENAAKWPLLLEAAVTFRSLGRPADAAAAYYRMLEIDGEDREALKGLEHVCRQAGDWERLADVLERQAQVAASPEERAKAHAKLGHLWLNQLNSAEIAVDFFAKAVDDDPFAEGVAEALTHLSGHPAVGPTVVQVMDKCRTGRDYWETTANRLENGAAHERDQAEAREMLLRAADIRASRLDQADMAMLTLVRLHRADANDTGVLAELWKTGTAHGHAEEVEEIFLNALDSEAVNHETRREIAKRLASAAPMDNQPAKVLAALAVMYRDGAEWESLLEVLKRLASIEKDPAALTALRIEIAETCGIKLGRKTEAVETLRRLLEMPGLPAAELERISESLEHLGAWEDLARALNLKLSLAAEPARKASILLRMAGIYRREAGNLPAAVERYEQAMDLDPAGGEARNALMELYAELESWPKLVGIYDGLLASAQDRKRRMELLGTIAEIYRDRIGQPHLAFMTLCRMWREDFTDLSVLDSIEKSAAGTGAWEELYFLYQEALEAVGDEAFKADISHRAAMVAAGRLGMDEEAEKHLRDILEIDPGHAVALNTIEEFLEQKGRWKDLADILRRKLDYARDPEARAALCIKIGASLGNMEGGVQGVIDAYNQALSHVPGDKRAFEALARVLDHERRWEELAQACLARAAVSTDQAEAQSLRLRAAAILRTEAADPRRAAGVYREALAADPGCMQALEALDGIYTGLESWKELLEVIEWRMAVEQDRAELQTLRSRAASMCAELLNDPVRAARHYEELRSLDPGRIGTLVSLEGIYDGLGAWEKLLETLRRHADLEDDPEEKAALLARMAELYSEKMGSADKAADLYRQVLQADPANITAVRRISAYCRERGDWAGALEMMGRETGLLGQSRDAVGVWFLMGKIHADTLLDPESARDCFARALGIDPSHVESLRALKAIHSSERNTSEYLKALLEEARHEPDPARKTELFFEAGGIYEDRLNDPTRAAACFEEALRLTPCHPPSARVLSDIYFRREDWARAGQCLEIVTAGRADGGQNLARQFYRLGFVNERMKEPVRALEAYRKAKELEPDYLPVLEGVTTALMNLERWEEAAGAYEEIVSRQGGTLSGSEIADLEFRIGGLYRRVGNNAAALEAYKRVLKADDRHTGALFALVEIHEALGENEDAYDLLVQLAFINEGREQFDLYMRTGLLCREKLDDQYRAIDAFSGAMAALEDGPAGLPAMDELYRLYRVTGQYQKSADLLVKIIEIEKEPSRLAAYHFELAELYKERLDGPDLAVEEYNKVLDIDPGQAKAFSAVETLLGSRKEWKRLEENYRAMIQRTPKEAKGKRLVLWRSLGELYRRVLKDTEAAIMAYEVVAGYEKDGLETLEILADLYSSRERHRAKAIKTHHTVVRLSNNPIRSVRALKKFYLASREYDKVFMACSVLKYLGQADGEDAKVLAALAPKARDTAQKPLTEELWEGSVIHPRAKGAPSAVMAYLRRHMGSSFVQSVETFGVRRKDVVDTDKSQIYFVNMFKYAVRATGVGDFTLYRAPAGMQGVRLVFSAPPAALAGEDMFKERPRKEIWFRLGRELALARPEFVIPSMLQPSELMALWSAVLSLVSPVHAQQAVTDPVIRWMETLKKNLTPDNLTALRALLAGRLSDGAQSGIEDWLEAVEYTCLRAGFALAGDLGICMAVAQESPGRLSRPAFRSVAREMVMYAVSEEYLALRVKLGLSVQA